MKKIIISLSILLLLQSCFNGSSDTATGLTMQENENFSLLIPESWGEIVSSDIPAPKSGKISLAYASSNERQGYLNNIIVLETDLDVESTSSSLMKGSIVSLKNTIESFKIIEEKNITFADGQSGLILTYSGKYNTSTPELIYLQTARICGEKAYYLTLSLAENLETYEKYEYILQTFRCN